jgi:DNA-binding SARP family transcriptional activator/predicted ATPase
MPHLRISLLGTSQITVDGTLLKITTQRVIPLLAYLAINGNSQTRDKLANLLWSEGNLSNTLASLRTTLWRMKSAGLDDWIKLEEDKIYLNYEKNIEVDVHDFIQKLKSCSNHGHSPSQICLNCIPALTEAVDLYHGEFMSEFNLSKAPAFDEWRLQEADLLNNLYMDALEKLVRGHRNFGDFSLAIQYARTLIRHDPYNDSAQYDLLQLYLITGQRVAAINHYKHYKDLLSRELDIEPSDEITSLFKQILKGRSSPLSTQKVITPIFLIADIEDAKFLWSRVGANKNDYLETYHNIFTETCRRFGGRILQKSEDGITVLFENGRPLHCAVTINQRVMKTVWGVIGPPNIRMALYTAAEDGTNHNFSMIARSASNLLSISWGGQIVFSEQTMRYLDQPSGSRYKDLGFHTLKDIKDPVHVFELLHPHLPSVEHRPLRSDGPLMVDFPSFTPTFLGRETELHKLAELIQDPNNRLITLVGSGGAGKTRLAAQFADQNARLFSEGAFFISLAAVQDPAHIPIILAQALKFSFYGPRDHTEQLCDYLYRMQILLVFDNFEHLSFEGGKFLAHLLNKTRNLKIIITTRERLNLIAETIMEVHGLPVPPLENLENAENYSSIRLFFQNAKRIDPGFNLENTYNEVIRICQLVNGLPLGIILASSWVRVYKCSQIVDEIEKNIDFLAVSAPDLAPRHRSLRAVFDSSWELLSEEERLILRRLSIFRSAFTIQAAQEICGASPKILAAFHDKSLLYFQNHRYEMLETFHYYIFEKLKEFHNDYVAAQIKFCDYYARYCAQKNLELNTSSQRRALDEMISEFKNIQTSWHWMIESSRWDLIDKVKQPLLTFHIMSSYLILGREFFHLAQSKLESLNDPSMRLVETTMKQYVAWMTIKIGFISEGLQDLEECLEVFHSYNSSWNIVMSLMFMAEANRNLGDFSIGKTHIENALRLISEIDIPKSNYSIAISANCQTILGLLLIEMGDFDQARIYLQASLVVHLNIGTHYGSISPLQGLAKIAYFQGDYLKAKELYLQALETATKIYEHHGMAVIHNNLANVYESLANPSESYHHVVTALNLIKGTGDRRLTAIFLSSLAYHQLRYLQHPSDAIRTYHESIEIFSTLGDLRGVAYSYYDISKAYLQVGLIIEAREYCMKSLTTAMTLDRIPLVLHSLHGFAHLYANTNRLEEALRLCNLIENHPQVEADTQKRAIVTRVELESRFTPDIIQAAREWGKITTLQDVIERVLSNNQT